MGNMGKEEIYTIPLWDAVRENNECPFCSIEHKLEKDIIDFCLSDAYMDEEFRKTTNKIGFCRTHFEALHHAKNRLGLTLVVQSHIQTMMDAFEEKVKKASHPTKNFFKSSQSASTLQDFHDLLTDDCYVCKRIKTTMDRYLDTFFYLYKKDTEFKKALKESKSFCMPHYLELIMLSEKKQSAKDHLAFLEDTLPVFRANMGRIQEDLQWFVNKYDYRYKDEPWKNAKDAAKRGIQKINKTTIDESS